MLSGPITFVYGPWRPEKAARGIWASPSAFAHCSAGELCDCVPADFLSCAAAIGRIPVSAIRTIETAKRRRWNAGGPAELWTTHLVTSGGMHHPTHQVSRWKQNHAENGARQIEVMTRTAPSAPLHPRKYIERLTDVRQNNDEQTECATQLKQRPRNLAPGQGETVNKHQTDRQQEHPSFEQSSIHADLV